MIGRFKEREENVKADIFCAYIALLKQTLPIQSWLHASDAGGKEEIPLTMLQNQVSEKVVIGQIKLNRNEKNWKKCHQ